MNSKVRLTAVAVTSAVLVVGISAPANAALPPLKINSAAATLQLRSLRCLGERGFALLAVRRGRQDHAKVAEFTS